MYYSKTLSVKLLRVAFEKISYLVQSWTHCLQLVSVHEVATGQIVLVAVPPSLAQSLSVSLSLLHHEFDTCEFQQMSPKLTAELRGLQETD